MMQRMSMTTTLPCSQTYNLYIYQGQIYCRGQSCLHAKLMHRPVVGGMAASSTQVVSSAVVFVYDSIKGVPDGSPVEQWRRHNNHTEQISA